MQFCNRIEFVTTEKSWFGACHKVIADSPDRWFDYLREQACRELKLCYSPIQNGSVPDHMLAGFVGGGGRWFIATETKDHSDHWEAGWRVTAKNAPDRRIWSVSYHCTAAPAASPSSTFDLMTISQELRGILTEIRDFARHQNLDYFAKCFQSGLDCLQADTPLTKTYHTDLIPADWYSLLAQQVLAACSASSVFGGMGSWNDLGFDDDENKVYERLSKVLYGVIITGIVSATNSKSQ